MNGQVTVGKLSVHWTKESRRLDSNHFSDSGSQKGYQFRRQYFTSSASALAIMGTRAKEISAAQPHRKDIFPVWASTQCAHADAKVIEELGDDLELYPKKKTFDHETAGHKDIHVCLFESETPASTNPILLLFLEQNPCFSLLLVQLSFSVHQVKVHNRFQERT